MMGRQTGDQSQLFYLFNLERRIPAGHLLRRINPVVTRILVELREKLAQEISPVLTSTHGSFSDRFGFNSIDASQETALEWATFDDRFSGRGLSSETFVGTVAPARGREVTQTATATSAPRVAARPVSIGTRQKQFPKPAIQLASASETSFALNYAPADPAAGSDPTASLKHLLQNDPRPAAEVDPGQTAIYDISSRSVYLPNGRRLEAHSGLGSHMDDPKSVASRNTGVTPPNLYELMMRESKFHGVRAIRLIPKDDSKMYGRSGILAHTYMLGPNGQSNGCVSFSDYPAFLDAYERGNVSRLLVVDHLSDHLRRTRHPDGFPKQSKAFSSAHEHVGGDQS
jgi:hypothetical protein